MRLHLDETYFISVLKQEEKYSCQIMELLHGVGMYHANFYSKKQDVISIIVYEDLKFSNTSLTCNSIEEVFNYHTECLKEILDKDFVFRNQEESEYDLTQC